MTNGQLKALIERIETLEGQKAEIQNDIKLVYAEAKGEGFDPKIMRQVLAARKLGSEEFERLQIMVSTYLSAL